MSARGLLAGALGLPEPEITGEVNMETCPSWDSMAHLRVVLAIEANLGRALEPDEIFSIGNLTDVERILECGG